MGTHKSSQPWDPCWRLPPAGDRGDSKYWGEAAATQGLRRHGAWPSGAGVQLGRAPAEPPPRWAGRAPPTFIHLLQEALLASPSLTDALSALTRPGGVESRALEAF